MRSILSRAPVTTAERVTAALAEERAAGYERAFRIGVEAVIRQAAYLAGTRGLSERQEVALRSAVAMFLSDAKRAMTESDMTPTAAAWATYESLQAHALAEHAAAVARLGKRAR